jgi:beta-glucuronidase
MLRPMTNPFRTAISLNGIWNFAVVGDDYVPELPLKNPRKVAVPASYNDLFTDSAIRDHVGVVCYERLFSVPKTLEKREIRLRIGAAGNRAIIYLDGMLQNAHLGGFLPIDLLIPSLFAVKEEVRLSILIDNRLDMESLPIGEVVLEQGKPVQKSNHDFFNYAGIHRDVVLYSRPSISVQDVTIKTKGHGKTAKVFYEVETRSSSVSVKVLNPAGETVAEGHGASGELVIPNPLLWDIGQGNLYTLVVKTPHDMIKERFGIRDIEVKKDQFLLNGKPVYFKGFGMHEDHVTIGKASLAAHNIRDFELLSWMHANSFRTSHYPYSEEMLDLADEYGILVIDELPAVGLNFWSSRQVFVKGTVDEVTAQTHKNQIGELIRRDKNHPSVVMLSLANEANTHEAGALDYFKPVFEHARSMTKLPLMIVEWVGAAENKVAQLADVIGLNRYIAWYTDLANLSVVEAKLTQDFKAYHDKFQKPMILTEFGADTISGFHQLPATMFSEEFQVEFLQTYQAVIQKIPYVIGEHVWNFADFQTKQGLQRFGGNKKGVFTRDRQPKMAAHWLRQSWTEK